jgi:malate permease and related proteins
MTDVLQSILSIIVLIAAGYVLAARGWFNEETSRFLARLVVQFSVPALTFSSLLTSLDRSLLEHAGAGIAVPFILLFGVYGLSYPVSALLRVPVGRRGIFRAAFTACNSLFIGMPVNMAIFGAKSVPFVLMYYLANTTLFWTAGAYGIKRDGADKSTRVRFFSWENVKKIFSITLFAVLLSLVFMIAGWMPPRFIMESCRQVGYLTTPLSMLYIGINIQSVHPSKLRLTKEILALLLARFVLLPLIMILVMRNLPSPELMKKVFVIEASMPVIAQSAIVAKAYGSDDEFASVVITLTTAASAAVIPLYMLLFTLVPGIMG